MGGLQGGVALVQRVAVAEVGQGAGMPQRVHAGQARGVGRRCVFVDIVAQKEHQVGLVGAQVAPRSVVAMFPALAGGKGDA